MEHNNNLVEGFSKRYGVHQLVWYELHENMESAITREKQLKMEATVEDEIDRRY